MKLAPSNFSIQATDYLFRLHDCFTPEVVSVVEIMAKEIRQAWIDGRNVFICGNGGSAANAIHLANDFHFGIGSCGAPPRFPGLRVEALPANPAILSCLSNDIGYENVFKHQIEVKSNPNDLLIVLSGSGNSPNIIKALDVAKKLDLISFAVLGFSGGSALKLADFPIHFKIDNMQIAEDTQLIVGHLCMQWLTRNKPTSMEMKPLS